MSSLSPIAQNPALTNLASLIFASNVPQLTLPPVMSAVNQNFASSVSLPNELDQAPQGVGMPTVYVKPAHLNYLQDFRTQQCPLFANHKCTQHKPFTCFHWHFPNQRRRRPLRKNDGTFSYSPDVYCDKYDETRGECPNGDSCPYLHRNAGDTERRYHLRYFKTGTCIHDSDNRGSCSRNGSHCAFAHGANDLRVPVYDIREVQEANDSPVVNLPASLEKERVLSEDPKWNDMSFVLANYKTEHCKKPPRMCRQGYACPFFHNSKDRRRGPQVFKYRSTPCPTVKSADEWLESSLCDQGDGCQYCHTRTEQQFHPEIYKSTKCNDVMQQQYCPRGPFCAFAHDETEMSFGRGFQQEVDLSNLLQAANVNQQQHHLLQQQQHQHQLQQQQNQPQQHQHQHQQQHQQQQQQLMLTRALSQNVWDPAAGTTGHASVHAVKGRTSSGASCTSIESGLGSMYRADSPVIGGINKMQLANQIRAAAAAAAAAAAGGLAAKDAQANSSSSAMLPDLDDLDLSLVENASSHGSDSLSPLTITTSTSHPIGIPTSRCEQKAACSPDFNPMTYESADGATEFSVPFSQFSELQHRAGQASQVIGSSSNYSHSSSSTRTTSAAAAAAASSASPLASPSSSSQAPGCGRRRRGPSGGCSSPSPSNYAQSPILMNNSPFSNPGIDLERLQYQQEISRAKQEAASLQQALLLAQRQRDEAQQQLETVRTSIRDIAVIADSAPKDFSACSQHELQCVKLGIVRQLKSVQMLVAQQQQYCQQQQLLQQQQQELQQQQDEDATVEMNLDCSCNSLGFSASLAAVAAVAMSDTTAV